MIMAFVITIGISVMIAIMMLVIVLMIIIVIIFEDHVSDVNESNNDTHYSVS